MRPQTHYLMHGMTNAPEYRVWVNMIQYCYNKNHPQYKVKGAKGITVCDRWLKSFEDFYKDIGSRPSKQHIFSRKDTNLNYDLDNCCWMTRAEIRDKRQSGIYYEIDGKVMTESEVSKTYNINRYTLRSRRLSGRDLDKLLVEVGTRVKTKTYTFNGETKTLKQWAESINIPYMTLYKRLNKSGWTFERAISERSTHPQSNKV